MYKAVIDSHLCLVFTVTEELIRAFSLCRPLYVFEPLLECAV